ncbi:MAG TPA: cytochrome c-type biogenesis protein [Steroidobacteraceae bacterium]|nr:cytochrome c-type biogenesis protein [Steroidobacteraceae bacterium]
MLSFRVWAVDSAPAFDDPQLQARYDNLTRQFRCMQCQNESIADSPVSLAADLRNEVREQIAQGKSDDEVRKFLSDRYGAFVLYKPPFEARTWLLWLGPVIFLIGGLIIAVRIIMQRSRLADNEDESDQLRDNIKEQGEKA